MNFLNNFNTEYRAEKSEKTFFDYKSKLLPKKEYGKILICETDADCAVDEKYYDEKIKKVESVKEYEVNVENLGTLYFKEKKFVFIKTDKEWLKREIRHRKLFQETENESFKIFLNKYCSSDEDLKMVKDVWDFIVEEFPNIDFDNMKPLKRFQMKTASKFASCDSYLGYSIFMRHTQDWKDDKTRVQSVFGISEMCLIDDLLTVYLNDGKPIGFDISDEMSIAHEIVSNVLDGSAELDEYVTLGELKKNSKEYKILRNAKRVLKYAKNFFTVDEPKMYELEWQLLSEEEKLLASIFSNVDLRKVHKSKVANNYFIKSDLIRKNKEE